MEDLQAQEHLIKIIVHLHVQEEEIRLVIILSYVNPWYAMRIIL